MEADAANVAVLEYEPAPLRAARGLASFFPRGRSVIIRRAAKVFGYHGPFVAEVDGIAMEIDLNERVSRTLYAFGSFEPVITNLFRRLLAPGNTALDVGANFGLFSLLAAQRIGPTGRIYAFEPDLRNVRRLQANIARNDFRSITHVPLGLFDKEGEVSFYLSSENEDNLGSSSIVASAGEQQKVTIKTTTLDAFLRAHSLDAVDMMKMDIEGAEVEALRGAADAIAQRRIRHMLLEVHAEVRGREQCSDMLQRLQQANYRIWFIREEGVSQADASAAAGSGSIRSVLEDLDLARHLAISNPHFLIVRDDIVLP